MASEEILHDIHSDFGTKSYEEAHSSSSANPLLLRLHHALSSCSTCVVEGADFRKSEESVLELVDFLNSISDSIVNEPEDDILENNGFQILSEIHRYIAASTLNQAVVDALSFELPKAVARFACASKRCLEMAESIVLCFTDKCSPRDMLSVLCEALGSPSEMFKIPNYFTPLLNGLPKVFVSIQRQQLKHVKAAVPVILSALKMMSIELDDEDADPQDLYHTAVRVADSIKVICMKLENAEKDKLHALLGLYVLEIMALISMGMRQRVSSSLPLVIQLSQFFQHCGLSYTGLIVGSDIDKLHVIMGDDGDDCRSCFSHVHQGALLSVIWGHKSNEVALAAQTDIAAVKNELIYSQTKRWQAIGMFKHIFSYVNIPWHLKQLAIDFLLSITSGNMRLSTPDWNMDCSMYIPSLYATLQGIQVVIMYASEGMLRKKAFAAFKKVLADVPSSIRFDLLMALIKNSDSSSMIAVLLDCVKEEMRNEITKRTDVRNGALGESNGEFQGVSFWSASVLELVELVLRPPKGGPPALPEYSDAVLAALNLYRFILITESTGKTNYTKVLLKENLQKVYKEWLLPLRTLVTGIEAENQKDYSELTSDMLCALNPVELVLYRCIELVEENIRQCA